MEEAKPKRKILVIDDSEDFLDTISYWLKARGFLVMTAISCEAGLKVIENAPIDIVFLDMRMPNVDGIETLRRIRAIRKDLPVVIVTAYAQDEMVNRAAELGISTVFPKDGDFKNLPGIIETALAQ